jgi:hypothetical protein
VSRKPAAAAAATGWKALDWREQGDSRVSLGFYTTSLGWAVVLVIGP